MDNYFCSVNKLGLMKVPIWFIVWTVIICFDVIAQEDNVFEKLVVTNNIIDKHFEDKKQVILYKRRSLLKPDKKIKILNPIYWVSAGLIYLYQNIISEQIQSDCIYNVSCSEYMKQSIKQLGFIEGTMNGWYQFINCHGWAPSVYPEYKFLPNGKINNVIDERISE